MIKKIRNFFSFAVQKSKNKNKRKNGTLLAGTKFTGSIFDPFIIENNGLFLLYFSIRKSGSIGVITSHDLKNWSDITTVFSGRPNSWETSVNRASVLYFDNTFYLYYTGESNGINRIGLATSPDGFVWKRNEFPILKPSEYFEKNSVMNPAVLYDKEELLFKMWYSAGDSFEPNLVCYAESKDGLLWKKWETNPIFTKSDYFYDNNRVSVGQVTKIRGCYLMSYIGYENIHKARVCLAISKNGIDKWVRLPINPIMNFGGRYSRSAVYRSTFSLDGNAMNIWYNGRTKNLERILFCRFPFDLDDYKNLLV